MSIININIPDLAKNPWLTIVGFLVTLLSFVVAIYFYFKGRKYKSPYFARRTSVLVEGLQSRINNVEVRYRNTPISNLSVSKIAFWNAGSEPILDSDVASLDRLRLKSANGVQLLDASIIFQKEATNNFRLGLINNANEVDIEFEFCRHFEGVIIQVIHTGTKNNDVDLIGTFKEVKQIRLQKVADISRLISMLPFAEKTKPKNAQLVIGIFIFMVPIIVAWMFWGFPSQAMEDERVKKWVFFGSLLVITALYWRLGFHILRSKAPPGFDAFFDEQDKKDA